MNEETKPAVICSEEYTKAVEADALVNAGMELMGSGLYQMCMGVKKMHDGKLYKEFGYQNFEDYCKSKGFSQQYGRQFVKIAEMAESENGNTSFHFEKLGVRKNYILALLEPEDRQELIATQNVDGMTVKELEAAKAEIDRLKQERDEAKTTIETKDKQFKAAMESKDAQLKAAQDTKESAMSECNHLNSIIREKESRIKELEEQPIQHDITDVDSAAEIERLKKELEDEQLRVMMVEKSAESKARLAAESVREEYERKLAEQDTAADTKDVFKAYLANAADALTRLLTYLESIRDDKNLPLYVSKVDGIVEMTQTRRNAL